MYCFFIIPHDLSAIKIAFAAKKAGKSAIFPNLPV